MNKPRGYDETAAAGEYAALPAGGYVCRIISVKESMTKTNRQQVEIALDIEEGPERGRFKREFDGDTRESRRWGAVLRQLTEDTDGQCNRYFKGLIKAMEESNPGWKPVWGEGFCSSCQGRLLGVVFRREQYPKQNGEPGWKTKPWQARSVDAIRKGVEAPADKLLEEAHTSGTSWANGQDGFAPHVGDLPF